MNNKYQILVKGHFTYIFIPVNSVKNIYIFHKCYTTNTFTEYYDTFSEEKKEYKIDNYGFTILHFIYFFYFIF